MKQEFTYSNKKKTPAKSCPLSSEKLRKKLTDQSTELRKERRTNLFNKKRCNLSTNDNQFFNSPTSPFSSTAVLCRDNEFTTIRIEQFNRDLEFQYSLLSKELEAVENLVNFIGSFENKSIYEHCSKEFVDYLLYKDPQLINYVNQDQIRKENVSKQFDSPLTDYDKSIKNTIILIDNIKNKLINCCLNHYSSSFIIKFFNFLSSNSSFALLTKDQQNNLVQKIVNLLSNRKLIKEEIIVYKHLFNKILDLLSTSQEADKITLLIQSLPFWKILILHTKFAKETITELNQSKSYPDSLSAKDFQEYLMCLFDLSHYLISSFDYGLYYDSNEIYGQNIAQLIDNLNLIQSSTEYLNNKSLIYFIQILNNYFDPSQLANTEHLLNGEFLSKLTNLIAADLDRSLTNNILGLFSNITCLEDYSLMLIDLQISNLLSNLLDKGKADLNLVFYILIIIKNIVSIDSSYFNLIFTNSFTYKLTSTFQFMNGDCLTVLCAIIDDCIQTDSTVIKKFFQPNFIENIPILIKSNNPNLIYLLLKILIKLVNQKDLKQDRLLQFISLFEQSNLIDLIDNLSTNQNSAVSDLASSFLDDYYKIAEYKENLYY